MKVGLIFGKFAPLTAGHVNFIRMAVETGVDRLYLFLSFDQKFNDTQSPWMQSKLGLTDRLKDLKLLVRDSGLEDRIIVNYVDESAIPGYPEGGAAYAKLIRDKIPEGVVLTHAFSSEPEYGTYFSDYFPEVEHVVLDAERLGVNISATRIRENLRDNFNMLSEQAKPRFVKRVAIIGVESTGKSTLAKTLARRYHTNFTPEIGRDICESEYCGTEEIMTREDYLEIALLHRLLERNNTRDAYKVTFSDTTNLITHFSGICSKKILSYDPMFIALSEEESDYYDLILFLDHNVPWVADPLRLQDTPEKREKTHDWLDSMVHSYYDPAKVVRIKGNDYAARTAQAIAAIEKLMEEK